MNKFTVWGTLVAGALAVGCSTHVNVASTHREDASAQSRVLAIAARNLEDSIHANRTEPAEEEAARAVATFHRETEEFARAAARWMSDDNVNSQYERMVEAWVKVKKTFPNLKPDGLTQDSYKRTEDEWEKLMRVTGYAGRKYEKKMEEGK